MRVRPVPTAIPDRYTGQIIAGTTRPVREHMLPGKDLRAVNWSHAAGELILIIVGILIAPAISD